MSSSHTMLNQRHFKSQTLSWWFLQCKWSLAPTWQCPTFNRAHHFWQLYCKVFVSFFTLLIPSTCNTSILPEGAVLGSGIKKHNLHLVLLSHMRFDSIKTNAQEKFYSKATNTVIDQKLIYKIISFQGKDAEHKVIKKLLEKLHWVVWSKRSV